MTLEAGHPSVVRDKIMTLSKNDTVFWHLVMNLMIVIRIMEIRIVYNYSNLIPIRKIETSPLSETVHINSTY